MQRNPPKDLDFSGLGKPQKPGLFPFKSTTSFDIPQCQQLRLQQRHGPPPGHSHHGRVASNDAGSAVLPDGAEKLQGPGPHLLPEQGRSYVTSDALML